MICYRLHGRITTTRKCAALGLSRRYCRPSLRLGAYGNLAVADGGMAQDAFGVDHEPGDERGAPVNLDVLLQYWRGHLAKWSGLRTHFEDLNSGASHDPSSGINFATSDWDEAARTALPGNVAREERSCFDHNGFSPIAPIAWTHSWGLPCWARLVKIWSSLMTTDPIGPVRFFPMMISRCGLASGK